MAAALHLKWSGMFVCAYASVLLGSLKAGHVLSEPRLCHVALQLSTIETGSMHRSLLLIHPLSPPPPGQNVCE